MGCELFKQIKVDRKQNKVLLDTCSNNVFPHTYHKYEILKDSDYSLDDKMIYIFYDLMTGNLQASAINNNTLPYVYALIKVHEQLKADGLDEYEDLYKKCNDMASIRDVYGKYYDLFKKYFKEKDYEVSIKYDDFYYVTKLGKYSWRCGFRKFFYGMNKGKFTYKKAYVFTHTYGKENLEIVPLSA